MICTAGRVIGAEFNQLGRTFREAKEVVQRTERRRWEKTKRSVEESMLVEEVLLLWAAQNKV